MKAKSILSLPLEAGRRGERFFALLNIERGRVSIALPRFCVREVDMKSQHEHPFKVIGTRPIRHDGVDKVTGRAPLWGRILRCRVSCTVKCYAAHNPHARIKSIDTSKAKALPGVKAVITGADFPEIGTGAAGKSEENFVNPRHLAFNIMARDTVLYDGHAVAAVAAISTHIAEEALTLITVEYEPLPFVQNVLEAMR